MALGFPVDEESPRLHQIVWYENDGSPERDLWKKHVICESFANAFEAIAADLAGDGQMEEVTTAWGEDTGCIAVFKHHGDPRGGPGRSKAPPRIASPIHRTTACGRRSVPSFPGQRKARMVGRADGALTPARQVLRRALDRVRRLYGDAMAPRPSGPPWDRRPTPPASLC